MAISQPALSFPGREGLVPDARTSCTHVSLLAPGCMPMLSFGASSGSDIVKPLASSCWCSLLLCARDVHAFARSEEPICGLEASAPQLNRYTHAHFPTKIALVFNILSETGQTAR